MFTIIYVILPYLSEIVATVVIFLSGRNVVVLSIVMLFYGGVHCAGVRWARRHRLDKPIMYSTNYINNITDIATLYFYAVFIVFLFTDWRLALILYALLFFFGVTIFYRLPEIIFLRPLFSYARWFALYIERITPPPASTKPHTETDNAQINEESNNASFDFMGESYFTEYAARTSSPQTFTEQPAPPHSPPPQPTPSPPLPPFPPPQKPATAPTTGGIAMHCTNCGAHLSPSGSCFSCSTSGAHFSQYGPNSAQPAQPPKPVAAVKPSPHQHSKPYAKKHQEDIFCKRCGEPVPYYLKWCKTCGYRVRLATRKKAKQCAILTASILIIAAMVLFGYWAITLKQKADFLTNEIVFVVDSQHNIYHTFDCPIFSSASLYWAHSTTQAVNIGCRPCTTCHK